MFYYFEKYPYNFRYIAIAQSFFCMGFFSLKALFILYTLHQFHLNQADIFSLYAIFMALCYATSFLGGYMADNIMGPRKTLICGGVLTTVGMGLFCVPQLEFLYIAMAFISLDTGFFKPNFSSALSLMFNDPADKLKKLAFSKLYVAMNVGSLIGILASAVLKVQDNWYSNLAFVSISFILSAATFYKLKLSYLKTKSKSLMNSNWAIAIIVTTLVIIYILLKNIESLNYVMWMLVILTIIWFAYILYVCSKSERYNLFKLSIYYGLFILSCALFEQMSSSLIVFVEAKVDRQFMGITLPTSLFMAINPALVLLFSVVSPHLAQRVHQSYFSSNLTKFTMGYGFLCLSFGILALRYQYSGQESVSFVWILASFSLQTMAEWSIVPVGFAIAAHYAPARYLSLVISFWLTGIAYGHLIAGKLANWSIGSLSDKLSHDYGQFFIDLMVLSGVVFIMLLLSQLGGKLLKPQHGLSNHRNKKTTAC